LQTTAKLGSTWQLSRPIQPIRIMAQRSRAGHPGRVAVALIRKKHEKSKRWRLT